MKTAPVDPEKFIIARKRKLYKFALFHNNPLCFEHDEWGASWPVDTIEVGAGTGLFSVEHAKQYPEKHFVAIDVKADRLQKGATAAAEIGLQGVRFLRTRADLLPELFPAHSLNTIWITFPDPFPKKTQRRSSVNPSDIPHDICRPTKTGPS